MRHVYDVDFPGRVTYHGSACLKKVYERFSELEILDRLQGTPFEKFFVKEQVDLNFSGVLIHKLLEKRIEPTVRGEVHFDIGGQRVRFGRLEYALVTGLS